jgi:hypothetical protein
MRDASIRAVLAAAALSLSLAAAPAAGEEVKVLQGMNLSLYGAEYQGNASSPFARMEAPADWALYPSLDADYSLRFQTPSGVSGQLVASVQGATSTSLALAIDQAWVRAVLGEGWGVAFGRRELNDWKDGGYWRPSDVVNNYLPWSLANGSGATSQVAGKDSIEILGLLPFPDFIIDLNAATVFPASLESPADLPFYLTAGSILDPFELRLKAAFQTGRLPYLGAAARVALAAGTLYADALWLQDQSIASAFGLGAETGSWFRYCAGVQWTLDISESRLANSLYLQAEYLRQDDGLDAAQMSSYFDGLDAMPLTTGPEQGAYGTAAGAWGGRFFALGRDYLYGAFSLGEIANEHVSLSAGCVLNVDDLSFAIRSSLTWSPRNLFSIYLSATNFGGSVGGEATMLPYSAQYSLSLSRSF